MAACQNCADQKLIIKTQGQLIDGLKEEVSNLKKLFDGQKKINEGLVKEIDGQKKINEGLVKEIQVKLAKKKFLQMYFKNIHVCIPVEIGGHYALFQQNLKYAFI